MRFTCWNVETDVYVPFFKKEKVLSQMLFPVALTQTAPTAFWAAPTETWLFSSRSLRCWFPFFLGFFFLWMFTLQGHSQRKVSPRVEPLKIEKTQLAAKSD